MKATEIPAADKEILIGCDPGADLSRTYWDRTSKVAGCAKVRTLMHGTRSSIWCPPKCGLPQAPLQPPRLQVQSTWYLGFLVIWLLIGFIPYWKQGGNQWRRGRCWVPPAPTPGQSLTEAILGRTLSYSDSSNLPWYHLCSYPLKPRCVSENIC